MPIGMAERQSLDARMFRRSHAQLPDKRGRQPPGKANGEKRVTDAAKRLIILGEGEVPAGTPRRAPTPRGLCGGAERSLRTCARARMCADT